MSQVFIHFLIFPNGFISRNPKHRNSTSVDLLRFVVDVGFYLHSLVRSSASIQLQSRDGVKAGRGNIA